MRILLVNMRYLPFNKTLSLLLIAIILCATTTTLCHEVRATEDVLCKHCLKQNITAAAFSADNHCHSCPDADQSETDHCASACYCSCHLPVTASGIRLRYSPLITADPEQENFTSPRDIYLSIFVPPDSLA